MLLWLVLFLIIIAISFFLAYRSMADFAEKPSNITSDYSLFLIRNPSALNPDVLNALHELSVKKGYIFTIERLFKGSQSALAIFAPKSALERFTDLNLLELEDYSDKENSQVLAWEVGVKDYLAFHLYTPSISEDLPELGENEQFWWQLTFQGSNGRLWPQLNQTGVIGSIVQVLTSLFGINNKNRQLISNLKKLMAEPNINSVILEKNAQHVFDMQIRAVIFSENKQRQVEIASRMESISSGKLLKLPKAFTNEQIFKFYQERAKMAKGIGSILATSGEIIQLVK